MTVNFKKRFTVIAVLLTLVLGLTGCAKKTSVKLTFEGSGTYELIEKPSNLVNFSHTDDSMTVTVKENGDYDFAVRDEDGIEYSFTLVYEDGNAEIETDDDIKVNFEVL